MRGGFSNKIKDLREKLLHFAAMIELELDFGEEDVEFANRNDLTGLINEILRVVTTLIASFEYGNAIKNGIPVAIVGKPNAGKSTLLNVLLQEDRAIVSEIAGTTRDSIEDEAVIEGIRFRFVDTAGLRETTDTIEAIGVARAKQKMKEASLILYLFDCQDFSIKELAQIQSEMQAQNTPYFLVANKVDAISEAEKAKFEAFEQVLFISAKKEQHLETLKNALLSVIKDKKVVSGDVVVTNLRHLEGLQKAQQALEKVLSSIEKHIFTDLLATEIRACITALGNLIGDQITTDVILGHIFSKFCIGK
jgi:tRNA modification GTPase